MNIDKELENIFEDPLLENIGKEDLSLFDVPENLKKSAKNSPDYVAQRVPCANFSDYEAGFKQVHQELKQGKRNILKYNKQPLLAGNYFITGGILVYLESIKDLKKEKNGTLNGRTRCVYENGTESNILLDSLRKSIYTDGYIITENSDDVDEFLQSNLGVNPDDKQDGWIYVLSSLSENPEIKNQENLYKIGFSTIPVEQRISNAKNEPTYLMDNVEVVSSWKTYNMNTHKFEKLIHQFFSAVQFRFEVKDEKGNKYRATEWYVVPFGIIETVINRIVDKSIVDYRYNPSLQSLEKIEKEETVEKKFDTTGMKVLTLNIKQVFFDAIMAGDKDIEARDLKSTTINKYTWLNKEDGKRYLKVYDAIRFYVGYHKDRESALVEVVNTTFDPHDQAVLYYLGRVLEKS